MFSRVLGYGIFEGRMNLYGYYHLQSARFNLSGDPLTALLYKQAAEEENSGR